MEGLGLISGAVLDGLLACPGPRTVLHVGCGGRELPEWLASCEETRLDIDPRHRPDILADMAEMGDIGPYGIIYCAHSLEHLDRHRGRAALAEFVRVLEPGGTAIVFVPDLEDVKPTDEVLYVSPAGPVTGLDLIYGMHSLIGGNPAMLHRTGFIRETLEMAMRAAGFARVVVRRVGAFNLMGAGRKA